MKSYSGKSDRDKMRNRYWERKISLDNMKDKSGTIWKIRVDFF